MSRVSFVVAFLALVALTLPANLHAQQEPVVEPGAKVRVGIGSVWHVGTLVEMRADSWVLEVKGRDSLLALPLGSVSSLNVRGQKTMALRGAVIGLVSGAMFGMAEGKEGEYDLRIVAVPLFALPAAGIEISDYRAVGGGSKSDAWIQLSADVFGRPFLRPKITEAGALGAAIIAGVGSGAFDAYTSAVDAMVKPDHTFEPDPAQHRRYQDRFEQYSALWPLMRDYLRGLA